MQKYAENESELMLADMQQDARVCGFGLADPGATRLRDTGAHDPTPTPYFVLEDLFEGVAFQHDSHLLDVGCGNGRVLAFFEGAGFEGEATGVELDPQLAAVAQKWSARYSNLHVVNGNALDLPLSQFTHFYLFNPFDTVVLVKFISEIESQVTHPITLIHMSDNGETYYYMGRDGWSLVRQGEFQKFRNARGRAFTVYKHPQHFSIWRYEP